MMGLIRRLLGERGGKSTPEPQLDDSKRLLQELVPLYEASLLAYLSAYGIDTTITRMHRNDMAESLAQILTIYSVAEDRKTVRRVSREELQGGIFAEGGRLVRFRDDRPAIAGLAVTRSALDAAVAALKDTKKAPTF
jgi:hypothetical protein